MPQHDSIYQITQMLSDKNHVQSDMQEAVSAFSAVLKERYINRIENAVEQSKQRVVQHPPKEITLLNAMKPFINENSHSHIDQWIDTLVTMNMIKDMQNEIGVYENKGRVPGNTTYTTASIQDSSVHEDGVYDIDRSCLNRKINQAGASDSIKPLPNLFLMMYLLG